MFRQDYFKAHDDISDIIDGRPTPNVPPEMHTFGTWCRNQCSEHISTSANDVKSQKFLGCYRQDSFTHVWFSWPAIVNQDGADASTVNPSL